MAQSLQAKSRIIEPVLLGLCEDPMEAMAVLDYCKNRLIIWQAQKQWEARNFKDKEPLKLKPKSTSVEKEPSDAPKKIVSGHERIGVRTVPNDPPSGPEVSGGGDGKTGKRLKRRSGKDAQGQASAARSNAKAPGKPTELKGSGLPIEERTYRIARPGDPDYVAPAPRDRKPKPSRPGEEIPGSFDSPPLPDPTDSSILIRGKGKKIGCSSCSVHAYIVKENIPQTMILNDALKMFEPLDEAFPRLNEAADIHILDNGAICIDCPKCKAKNGITIAPAREEVN